MLARRLSNAGIAPPGRLRAIDLDDRTGKACALTSAGEVICRGRWDNSWDARTHAGADYVAVGANEWTFCALTASGDVDCPQRGWGGHGQPGAQGEPGAPEVRYLAISVSEARACALTDTGDIACWGDVQHDYLPWPP